MLKNSSKLIYFDKKNNMTLPSFFFFKKKSFNFKIMSLKKFLVF